MTAQEIRKIRDESICGRVDGSLTEESQTAFFLSEIAAQLAEMNERADPDRGRQVVFQLGIAVRQLIAAGDVMAQELGRYYPAGKSAIDQWKGVTGKK
jgi:hypothetical protein